ncbi:hypothetical protein HYC85_029060 [Camellia sinensis]|uniref:Uncharacterized protein n=1 Tax=Camellia sinensis TaxID=4442 RepID=A0A7J7FX64_CAMSI|nr:hypothetical protein HYC85_029060 [Camellia sinensis]
MSGRYLRPLHLDQGEPSGKDAKKGKKKETKEDVVLKQLKKIQADISNWSLPMASREHLQAMLSTLSKAKLSINTTSDQLVSMIMPGKTIPTMTFSDKELPHEHLNHNKPLYVWR